MIDPFRGIMLNDRFYNYDAGSYREVYKIRNNVQETQFSRNAVVMGRTKPDFTLAIHIENEYIVSAGSSVVGSTFWKGVSRLADMLNYMGGTGPNMPITFVNPYGMTFDVIPVGSFDLNVYRSSNPGASGMEFIANVTLNSI
jgi:hypothetical protein